MSTWEKTVQSPFSFQTLLQPLHGSDAGDRLGRLAAQVKVEQATLAEAMLNAKDRYPGLDFFLEESRRDLTVRTRADGAAWGSLVDWVEAKMCFSDCLARSLTEHGRAEEYCELLQKDASKQESAIAELPEGDIDAIFTSLLLVLHREKALPRQKYYPSFRNRRNNPPEAIEKAAIDYVRTKIVPYIQREIDEQFVLTLQPGCRLHVFAMRARPPS